MPESSETPGQPDVCCDAQRGHPCRERAMVVIEPGVWCDPCLVPLVKALNAGELRTVASCCGHGRGLGRVALADGRELFILPSFEAARALETLEANAEARGISNAILRDRNGELSADRAALEAVARRLLDGWVVFDAADGTRRWNRQKVVFGYCSDPLSPEEARILDLLRDQNHA